MKIKYLIVSLLFSIVLLTSCEKEEPEVGYTATYPVSGEWWVTYKVETSPGTFEDIYGVGYTPLFTYNTAANIPTEIWVSDAGNFWNYSVKSGLDMGNLGFSANNVTSIATNANGTPYNIKVNITDGKVIKEAGRSKTGVTTDSIYFKVSFEDDEPGTIYHVSGHRRTGFLEDEF